LSDPLLEVAKDPLLEVAKLDLQLVELPLINFAFHFGLGATAVRSF